MMAPLFSSRVHAQFAARWQELSGQDPHSDWNFQTDIDK